ncbi:hypothetical protein B5E53_13755 [Eubacterium sp. An11]|uniref:flavodoxin family protein n=1 Tax=Eubacterium sp. An11 TaxID=1965542 RepID=UPI000B381BB7|nr:flavodoxin family protein [Eubacterium sp. An11]OUQ64744.1 hypothetical protein B5E53_13755 [Eubacterium sp. An11]
MKVVVINGSPRDRGNSDLLCDQWILGAEEAGHEVEKIALREKKIQPCKACYACFRTGVCVQKDDMAEILKKIEDAFVIVTGHDGRQGLKRTADDLTAILQNLGCTVRRTIWGERVWQKGEVIGTRAMEEAYQTGKNM